MTIRRRDFLKLTGAAAFTPALSANCPQRR